MDIYLFCALISVIDLIYLMAKVRVHRPSSYASHATDFILSCIETLNSYNCIRIMDNAYMRCVPM
ncbi:hypothetical protein SFRURICE_013628, partial [Spodoptera frugiperda]